MVLDKIFSENESSKVCREHQKIVGIMVLDKIFSENESSKVSREFQKNRRVYGFRYNFH